MSETDENKIHERVELAVKQAVREAVERKRALERKVEVKSAHSETSSTR